MQIVTDWHVTNISQVPVRMLSARLLQPQLDDPEAFSVIFTAKSRSSMHCNNAGYAPAVGGTVVRCGEVLGTPIGLSPSQPRGTGSSPRLR